MKAFTAALVAVGILYVVDYQFYGRYSGVIQQAATSLLSH